VSRASLKDTVLELASIGYGSVAKLEEVINVMFVVSPAQEGAVFPMYASPNKNLA
jgi:hypothetical protein